MQVENQKLIEFRQRLETQILLATQLLPAEEVFKTLLAIGVVGLEKLNGKEYIGHFLSELGIELMLSPTAADDSKH